ncbi:ATP-binding protein [Methyloversatilis thermotolerans]|uniref:ATP-binding protein n=1 Tax=Methyloversatilis thermotolerans TaxID=1346290 RepID=UPI00037B4A77|nr:ATP-binding protein [Methyloversatilis thermotolerans]
MSLRERLPDTLFLRFFALMWLGLAGSHLVAYAAFDLIRPGNMAPRPPPSAAATDSVAARPVPPGPDRPPDGERMRAAHLPPLPSLPPWSSPDADEHRPPGRSGAAPGLPLDALLTDYAIRVLLIGLVAWYGARWLTRPMHELAAAADALNDEGALQDELTRLDERRGSREVRRVARVFNRMVDRIHSQLRQRRLLTAALSHDVRTPLARMRMRAEQLQDADMAARFAADIGEIDRLLQDALEALSPAVGAFTVVDLDALMQAACDDAVEQGLPVSCRGIPVAISSEPVALRRILDNLVGNALRYGHCARLSLTRAADGEVGLHVDDDGPGIPEADLKRVCEPFLRLEDSRSRDTGGSGLGLYIAREMACRIGARLSLSNRAGGGLRASILWEPHSARPH